MILRVLLALLGLAALAICACVMLIGPTDTAWASERAFAAFTGWRGPPSGRWPPTMDSELRFYAPFWGAYGVLLLMAARDLAARSRWVPWLAAVFFAGGVGRAISFLAVGAPHPVFTLLMAIELALPPVLLLLWLGGRQGGRE